MTRRRASAGGSGSRRLGGALSTALLAIAVAAATGHAHPHPLSHGPTEIAGHSTLEQTIIGDDQEHIDDPADDAFSFLRLGDGEPFTVREDLGRAKRNRANRRRSIVYLGHMTDMQLVDTQSPGRVEFLDPEPSGFASSAHRPQEALITHATELSIRQMNRFRRSPVRQGDGRHARMLNAVMTGDLADNQQLNETLWVRQLFQGGHYEDGELVRRTVEPNSGSGDVGEYSPQCQAAVSLGLLDPAEAEDYVGVQDYDDYPGGVGNVNYYDPDQPQGTHYGDWPTYEGLLDRAVEPFRARGLRVPSYIAFGNHDMLAQGNQWANAAFDEVIRGCTKPFPIPSLLDAIFPIADVPPEHEALPEFAHLLLNPPVPGAVRYVPPDERRRYIDRREFKALLDNGFQDDQHGFAHVDPVELEQSDGAASYYSFRPRRGVRYIVLDTVSYGGLVGDSSTGNIDHPQFQWLERELRRAERRDELVIGFGHHGYDSLTSTVPHEFAPPCVADDDPNPGCDRDPRDSRAPGSPSPHQGDDLRDLLLQFPHVIAYVAGHSHDNRVQAFERPDGSGGYWEIKSPAVIDWPPQHRVIDVMDNRDGTLSIFGVMLDYTAPAGAPEGAEGDEVNGFDLKTLASIARTLTYNDPQVGPGDGEEEGPQGSPGDRNVELLIRDPRRGDQRGGGRDPGRDPGSGDDDEPRVGAGTAGSGSGTSGEDRLRVSAAGSAAAKESDAGGSDKSGTADSGRGLPFSGLPLLALLLAAGGLLAGGRALRRRRA